MFKLFLVATLVAVSCAYDFKDSDFNQVIHDSSLRTKRDTDCHSKWIQDFHCCNGDTINKEKLEKLLNFKHECATEVWGPDEEPSYDPFNCEQLQEVKEKVICLAGCIAKKFDLLDDKDSIKRDALIEHFKTVFQDTEWKVKAIETIVDKCIGTFDATKIEEKKCNPFSMHMMHCTWKEFIHACPKESQSDNWQCKKIREKIEKGDEHYLTRVHFHRFIRIDDHGHHDHHETEKKEE